LAQATGALSRPRAGTATNRISLPLLRIQERRLLLAMIDSLIALGALMAAYDVWKAGAHPAADNMATMPWAWVIGGATSWLAISWLSGAYDLGVADRLQSAAKRTLTITLFAGIEGFAAYWAFLKTYPRPALAFALVAVPATVLAWRAFYSSFLRRPASATRVLVLGSEDTYQDLISLTGPNEDYYRIVGFVKPDGANKSGGLGDVRSLTEITRRTGAHRIVVAPRIQLTSAVVASLTSVIERGVEVFDFNSAYEEMAGKVAVDHVGDHWLASLPTRPKSSSFEEIAMRALDVVGAAAGLLITAVLLPVLALAIRLGSRGPVFYSQERLGRGGRPFTIFKFRSMAQDAEATGAQWAGDEDPRITRFGHLLRGTHLDELPQFWNILRGEMSLVGPRPERPEFTETLSGEIPFYRLRLSVRPGLTGLKQIKVGYASSIEEHLEVLRHDLYYLKHRSLALNVAIVARTLGSVVGLEGR
jgi:exopolysaccharide biosynthesis polyprenyl glycosylphosphotransferase